MLENTQTPTRLYSLDALRGVAAISIVFWHWRHYWAVGGNLTADFKRKEQPLFEIFFLFYNSGALAVDLFFTLSGFIFFWLYSKPIGEKKVSARAFLVLRLSRLYPLHFCTLVLVAMGQAAYLANHSTAFFYQYNDFRHFILNVLLLSSIGLERGYSFNAPIWSVSVEVVLYSMFFALCWLTKARLIILLCLSAFGTLAVIRLYEPIGRGIGSFFLGGGVHCVFAWVLLAKSRVKITRLAFAAMVILWTSTLYFSYTKMSLDSIPFFWRFTAYFPVVVLFPITVLSLALLEVERGTLCKRLSFLGDISYSIYLWHFPLQLAMVLAMFHLGG